MPIKKIISGGQTGVDRAALDAAIKNGIAHGGWCPRGRAAEDGVIDAKYALRETPSGDYAVRTEWNVRDADGTLILNSGPLDGGTAATLAYARVARKPWLLIALEQGDPIPSVQEWIRRHQISVLNVAGPRESKRPGVYRQAFRLLDKLCKILNTKVRRN
jgi:hypothetical protein